MPLWPYILKVFVIIYFGFHLVSVRMPEPYYLYFVNVMELWNLLLLPPSFPQNLLHSAGLTPSAQARTMYEVWAPYACTTSYEVRDRLVNRIRESKCLYYFVSLFFWLVCYSLMYVSHAPGSAYNTIPANGHWDCVTRYDVWHSSSLISHSLVLIVHLHQSSFCFLSDHTYGLLL